MKKLVFRLCMSDITPPFKVSTPRGTCWFILPYCLILSLLIPFSSNSANFSSIFLNICS